MAQGLLRREKLVQEPQVVPGIIISQLTLVLALTWENIFGFGPCSRSKTKHGTTQLVRHLTFALISLENVDVEIWDTSMGQHTIGKAIVVIMHWVFLVQWAMATA